MQFYETKKYKEWAKREEERKDRFMEEAMDCDFTLDQARFLLKMQHEASYRFKEIEHAE